MKKILIAAMTIAALILVACSGSSSKPSGMSQKTYEIGCDVLKIMDKYNDGDLSKDEAISRLDSLDASLSREQKNITDSIERLSNSTLSAAIFNFIFAMNPDHGSSTYDIADRVRSMLEK